LGSGSLDSRFSGWGWRRRSLLGPVWIVGRASDEQGAAALGLLPGGQPGRERCRTHPLESLGFNAFRSYPQSFPCAYNMYYVKLLEIWGSSRAPLPRTAHTGEGPDKTRDRWAAAVRGSLRQSGRGSQGTGVSGDTGCRRFSPESSSSAARRRDSASGRLASRAARSGNGPNRSGSPNRSVTGMPRRGRRAHRGQRSYMPSMPHGTTGTSAASMRRRVPRRKGWRVPSQVRSPSG